uniref:Uncharacterized protein n=1 Tax=Arundo donax TaxID=35708 RepID=A0A0A9B152_ARUDO
MLFKILNKGEKYENQKT